MNSLSLKNKRSHLSLSISRPFSFSLPNSNFLLSRCSFDLWWWLFILDGFHRQTLDGGAVTNALGGAAARVVKFLTFFVFLLVSSSLVMCFVPAPSARLFILSLWFWYGSDLYFGISVILVLDLFNFRLVVVTFLVDGGGWCKLRWLWWWWGGREWWCFVVVGS